MMEQSFKRRFDWRFASYATIGAVVVYSPMMVYGNGIGPVLGFLAAAAMVSWLVFVAALVYLRRRPFAVLSMLTAYCSLLWMFHVKSYDINTAGRWFLESKNYKTQVLAQPEVVGSLKHVEWDGWGFAGAGDTTVYLVFDPSDALSTAAKINSPGKFSGLPCEVVRVHRLEKHWYTALFYTDTGWDYCS